MRGNETGEDGDLPATRPGEADWILLSLTPSPRPSPAPPEVSKQPLRPAQGCWASPGDQQRDGELITVFSSAGPVAVPN